MSLFSKVFTGKPPVADGRADRRVEPLAVDLATDTTPVVEETRPNETSFMSYVKDVMLHGASKASPPAPVEKIETDWSYEDDEDEFDLVGDEDPLDEDEDEAEEADDDEAESKDDDLEEDDEPTYALTERQQALQTSSTDTLTQASSTSQKGDIQVQRIVDGLFDRMHSVWPAKTEQAETQVARSEPPKKAARSRSEANTTALALTESKAEISKLIRREIPQAMKGELVKVMRTEIMRAVRAEIVRVVREEFEVLNQTLAKSLERLHAIEARMAKIEGAVGQEVKVNFPKGAVKISAPVTVTVPEREVKVAAPINVQPPSVVFDEGAISVQFNKPGGKREVRFERDPHDQNIKTAEIIDVPSK